MPGPGFGLAMVRHIAWEAVLKQMMTCLKREAILKQMTNSVDSSYRSSQKIATAVHLIIVLKQVGNPKW